MQASAHGSSFAKAMAIDLGNRESAAGFQTLPKEVIHAEAVDQKR
jgi:hypothetical protein